MEQRNLKNNLILIILSFIFELIFINIIFPINLGIAIYLDIYKYLEIIVVILGIDIIYAIFCLDRFANSKNIRNVLNQYKNSIIYKTKKYFVIIEMLKILVVLYITKENIAIVDITLTFILTAIIYLVLANIFIKEEKISQKILKLKFNALINKKTKLSFILIKGKRTPDSLNLQNRLEQEINKNHIYINMQDFEKIKNKRIRNLIEDNTIAVVHELKVITEEDILNTIASIDFNNVKIYHIITGKSFKKTKLSDALNLRSDIKICDIDSVVEFVENFFEVPKLKKINTKHIYNFILKNKKDITEKKEDKILENLENVYINNFNARQKNLKMDYLPKNDYLMQMYKNAFLNQSAYQSILLYFNYLTVMAKSVQYYSYAINPNSNFLPNRINNTIIKDNPSCYLTQILVNIFENKKHPLYRKIRENKISLSKDDEVLVTYYLSKLLNINIEGKEITFEGLIDLFLAFRNKIEAHGIINDTNVYAVWNLTYFFVNTLNEFLNVNNLEFKYLENENIKLGYDKKLAILGEYEICINNQIYLIKDRKAGKNTYINYLTGESICK